MQNFTNEAIKSIDIKQLDKSSGIDDQFADSETKGSQALTNTATKPPKMPAFSNTIQRDGHNRGSSIGNYNTE